jgi:hypothetical protein
VDTPNSSIASLNRLGSTVQELAVTAEASLEAIHSPCVDAIDAEVGQAPAARQLRVEPPSFFHARR